MSADRERSSRGYPAKSDGAIRYVPVTRRGEIIGYLWASVADDAASFRATPGDNLDRLGAYAAWDERLAQSRSEGLTPLAALRRWVGAPEDPRGGGIPSDAEEIEAVSEIAMIRELIDPNYVDRSDQWEELLFQGDMESFLRAKEGEAEPGSYPFYTDAAVRYLPVRKNGVPFGYLWASVNDDAAGYFSRAEVAAAATDTYRAWVARLDQACAEGLSPIRAVRQWVGIPEDPVAGEIPSDAVEKQAPGLGALEQIAGIS
jgi:hypothetical protein